MAEFINTKEQIIKVGDKISITNDGSLPFLVKRNGSTTNVAFNKDGEYLVSVFDGKATVTTLKSDQNDGVVITPDCVKFPESVPNLITLSTDKVIADIDDGVVNRR